MPFNNFEKKPENFLSSKYEEMLGEYLMVKELNDEIAVLHLTPKLTQNEDKKLIPSGEKITVPELLKDIKDSLPNLANALDLNGAFYDKEKIGMISWIVTTNPGLIERFGFEVCTPPDDAIQMYERGLREGIVPQDKMDIKPSYAEMRIDDYIERYLEPSKESHRKKKKAYQAENPDLFT